MFIVHCNFNADMKRAVSDDDIRDGEDRGGGKRHHGGGPRFELRMLVPSRVRSSISLFLCFDCRFFVDLLKLYFIATISSKFVFQEVFVLQFTYCH